MALLNRLFPPPHQAIFLQHAVKKMLYI